MPKNQPSPGPSAGQDVLPQPVSPTDGALVHVRAVPFEWSQAGDAADYRLQIARDADFEEVVATVSTGDATSVTLYHTLDDHADTDLFWRVGTGPEGPWGPAASFHAGGEERVRSAFVARDRAAREEAQASLARHLEGQHRVPVVLPEEQNGGRQAALVLGLIVASFVVLLVVLFIFGWVQYPAEAVGQ